MELGNSAERRATEIIIDTQTEIKELIKKCLVSVLEMIKFSNTLNKILDENLKDIKNEQLKETARKTLKNYAYEELDKMSISLNLRGIPIAVALAMIKPTNTYTNQLQGVVDRILASNDILQVDTAYSQLGNSQAMVRNNQSLYGHSELVARYEQQQEMLQNLKEKTNLVICDTHSDCSDRCFPWQGKVYSLDGTYGTTSDGRQYQPLENATNVIDKYGHRNGLLGYNCRHKLIPFKDGLKPVYVTRKEQQRQDELTKKQRLLEHEIRYSKDLAISYKGVNNDKYKKYRDKAKSLQKEYVTFCEKNNRVQYRSRIDI